MSLFGTLFKVAGGFLTGGPAGALAAGASLLLKPRGGPPITAADSIITSTHVTPFSYDRTQKIYTTPTNGGTNNVPHGVLPSPSGPITPYVMAAACPAGHRLNKSTYVTRGGGTSHWPVGLAVHPKGTTCVKRRRRNVGNAKALRRAISRVKGFVKLARKAHSLVGGHRTKQRRLQPGQNIEIVRS